MAANLDLAKARGISDDDIAMINVLHEHLEMVIAETTKDDDREERIKHVRSIEFLLQDLWKFTRDSDFHTWVHKLYNRFRELDYVGTTFRCTETGSKRVVERVDLHLGSKGYLFTVGKGFIDFGGYHVRIVGPLERVK